MLPTQNEVGGLSKAIRTEASGCNSWARAKVAAARGEGGGGGGPRGENEIK